MAPVSAVWVPVREWAWVAGVLGPALALGMVVSALVLVLEWVAVARGREWALGPAVSELPEASESAGAEQELALVQGLREQVALAQESVPVLATQVPALAPLDLEQLV
ncbi:hypothetical protein [Bradyrhizobium liaoningense]|uniref:hypothetical protein n=1 Tax=Bradyrhizobium liaoningense TaxID=43992 RepID=UPI001BAE4F5F|nr:hypothetical protein [Bradyrhizobium liaoningense]MBR1167529.1 hypothetical protein [Bradyrhizobium liaoningense]